MKTLAVMAVTVSMSFMMFDRPLNAAEIDLAPQAVMHANNEAGGYAFRKPFVYAGPIAHFTHPTAYLYPWQIEAWFPGDQPVTVSRVTAQAGTRKVTRWSVEAWDSSARQWRTISRHVGDGGSVAADFEPVQTRGIRLNIEASQGNAWGDLSLSNLRILGPGQELSLLPKAPAAVTLKTDRPENVFKLGETMAVTAVLANPDAAAARDYTVEVEWTDFYLRPVAPMETRTLSLPAGKTETLVFGHRPVEQGAYFCRTSLRYRDALVNQTLLLCGSRDPEILDHIQPFRARKPLGEPSPEALVGEGRLLWSTEMYHQSSSPHFLPGPAHFRELKQAGGNFLCIMPTWDAVQPLPGVYNFAYYDHCLRLAEEYGLRVEFGLWRYNFGAEHLWWLEDEYARNADGKVGTGINRMFSLAGEKNRQGILKTVELCLKRYRGNPWVGIWQFKVYGHVDWMFPGGWEEFDFSEPYRQAFAAWLREVRGFTLEELSRRHGIAYASWDAVTIGKPIWWGGPQNRDYSANLELRPLQNDTLDFRDWIMNERCREVYQLVRSYDATRMIGNWLQPVLARGGIELTDQYMIPGGHNGGETLELIRPILDMEAPGKWARIEPAGQMNAHVGKEKALNWLLFNCGAARTKQVNYVFPVWEQNPCWEAFARPDTQRLMVELTDAVRPRSRVLGLHSYATNHREGRANQSYMELDRWFRMLSYSCWMAQPGNGMQWQLSDGALTGLDRYDLIIDDHSRVIPIENIRVLSHWVEDGGTLVLFSNAGEAALGATAKDWPLLRALGYPVDPATMERIGGHATLRAVPGNPVLPETLQLAVQAYPVLSVPAGGQILATIDGKPGAVLWPVGRGRILLLAGKLGDYDLGDIWGRNGVKDGNFWGKRGEAQRQVEAALVPTLRAVVAWSGAAMQQPLTWDSYDGDVLGYYKHNRDTHYVVFLNRGKQAHEPKFNLTGLPPGDYSLRRINLDTDEQLLGHQSATNLAGGVEIGLIQPDRMVAIRLQRLP